MKKVLLFVWVICIFLGAVASGSNLEINILSVGCGNFVLLKRDNNVLVIDCGVGSGVHVNEETLKNILRGSNNCKVIVTHEHEDHYSVAHILDACFQEVSGRNAEFFHGWFSKKTRVVCGDMRYLPLLGNLDGFDGCLGDGVLIRCIIPREENKDRHVNNLVVGIKYGNISLVKIVNN